MISHNRCQLFLSLPKLTVICNFFRSKGNGAIAGLVIGLSLMAMILVGLNITGLSVNPARSLAPAVFVGGAALQQVWIFILAPIVGGVLAALVAKNCLGTEE